MKSPYDIRTEETRNRIMVSRNDYYVNKYYKSAEGDFYYYINQRGYYHIVKPAIMSCGKFIYFEIRDYLLTRENTLKETKAYGNYKTLNDCISEIEKNMD